MGVDAEMAVAAPQEISERELLRLSYSLCSAFGPTHFMVNREGKYGAPHHALTMPLPEYFDLSVPADTKTTFRVQLFGRYYGPGYERGNLPLYLNIKRWFQTVLPGCTVFYGGDTSYYLDPLTDEAEEELWRHFAEVQHLPYVSHEGMTKDGIDFQWCEFCEEAMQRYGWGSGYAKFRCQGCGVERETRDSGHTWDEKVPV